MRPFRVGIVAESYFPNLGGIQEHVRNLRNLLDRQGVEIVDARRVLCHTAGHTNLLRVRNDSGPSGGRLVAGSEEMHSKLREELRVLVA